MCRLQAGMLGDVERWFWVVHVRTADDVWSYDQRRTVPLLCEYNIGLQCVNPLVASASLVLILDSGNIFNPLMGTLKPQSNGPLYNNSAIGTLAVDGWAVTFGTATRGLGGLRPRPVPSWQLWPERSHCFSLRTVSHSEQINVTGHHVRPVYKCFFSRRVVQCWNNLPACNENCTSLTSFKQLPKKLICLDVTHSLVHDNVWFLIEYWTTFWCFIFWFQQPVCKHLFSVARPVASLLIRGSFSSYFGPFSEFELRKRSF